VETPVLVGPNFTKSFILDVNWSIRGVGAILSQKSSHCLCQQGFVSSPTPFSSHGRKVLCSYWGIMYFRQYLHQTPFLLHIEHKPLVWLAINLNAYGRKGRWIVMLQDF